MLLENWEYLKGDLGGIWEVLRPAPQGSPEGVLTWEKVRLPHCMNGIDAVDPDAPYYQGIAWYRTTIRNANPFAEGRTILRFLGAGQNCKVYLDETEIGSHTGGYDEWEIDLSDSLNKSASASYVLSVRCDNARNLEAIPSDLSDFNIYGGLYRPVELHFEPAAYLSEILLTPRYKANDRSGSLEIRGRFNTAPSLLKAKLTIASPEGEEIAGETLFCSSELLKADLSFDQVDSWSPEAPLLYSCRIEWDENGETVSYEEHFGFRSFHFEKNGPFTLNGERLLLKGTHRHEDHAGVQAAQNAASVEEEMKMIKAMGANFIRLGHYQQSRHVLELCDRLGILVWEEIPWCRGGLGGKEYQASGLCMLKKMIRQHHNHPSIILWGLGNENDWPGDFSSFAEQNIRSYMRELHDTAHAEDPERKTAIRRCEFCKDIPDVYSPSIWAGWYRGHYREYKQSTLDHIAAVDHFLHVEWGASSHAGRYSEDPYLGLEELRTGSGTDERGNDAYRSDGIARVSKDGNWSENYACDLFDWTLKEQLDMSILTGTAFWPFKDFATPLRPENPIPKVNQKGVVQRDLTPKESYYVVRSYWSEEPMLRIFGHDWAVRWGEEGEQKEFRIYSNCTEAELFLDGRSLGRKKRNPRDFPAAGLRWNTPLASGPHKLKAIGYTEDGRSIEDAYAFRYHAGGWGEPARILSTFDKSRDSRRFWRISICDEKGNPCLDFEGRVRFSAAGSAPLQTGRGTATGSAVIECANGRAAVELNSSGGEAVLAARVDGLPLCTASYSPEIYL